MFENKIPMALGKPFVVWRRELINGKDLLLIYSMFSKELVELNTPASIRLLELCNGKRSIGEIAALLSSKFNTPVEDVIDDMKKMLNILKKESIIVFNEEDIEKILPNLLNLKLTDRPFLDYMQKNNLSHLSAPLNVRFLPTMRCFGRCIYCQAEAGDQAKTFGNEMTTEQIKRLIKRCYDVGVQSISVLGGEPFLREDMIEILSYATHLKISTSVSTNGVLLANREIVKNLANAVNQDYFSLQISIEGSKPEVHEYLRPGAKFESVVKAIENALHYKIHTHTNTVLTKANINDVPNLMCILSKLRVKLVAFSQFEPIGCGGIVANDLLLSPYELYQVQNEILPQLQKQYPTIHIFAKILEMEFWDEKRTQPPTDKPIGRCVAGTTDMTIGPDGTVLPCAWFTGIPEFWAENALEKDILNIWRDSKIFRKLRNVEIKGKCEHCEFNRSCYKGCHVLKWALYKDIHIPDPKCWYIPGDRKTIYPPKEVLGTMKPSYQKDLRNKKGIKG